LNRSERPFPPPAEIAEALTRVAPRLGVFAAPVAWYSEITSTNDVVAARAEQGAPEGTVVAADTQTAGRGRQRRGWSSPAGAGVYVSVLLRPSIDAAALLTIAAGVAIAEGIEAATGLVTQVKWPNDIYASGRKLAGILAEAGSSANALQYVVLGFGINVMPAAYPPDVAARATSIESELGRGVDRGLVLAECLAALAARYTDLQGRRGAAVVDAWRRRAAMTFGRPLAWQAHGRTQRGVAENIDDAGALLVRTGNGVERLVSGDVEWI
jgi:BirA family biotin operon repressor/biotin-[acetyl-CoA-carboxylase] ligase